MFEKVAGALPLAADLPAPWSGDPPKDAEEMARISEDFIQTLNTTLAGVSANGPGTLRSVLLADGSSLWRDHLVLDWRFRCYRGSEPLYEQLEARSAGFAQSVVFSLHKKDEAAGSRDPELGFLDLEQTRPCILCFAVVKTSYGQGRALFRLVQDSQDDGRWKAFTVYTALQSLHGVSEVPLDSSVPDSSRPTEESQTNGTQILETEAFIVGAGHSGLFVAARLKALGIKSVVVDRSSRIGDSWRNRYDSLVLHDTSYYAELPVIKYPPDWPVYASRAQFADNLEKYAARVGAQVVLNAEVQKAEWDGNLKRWTIRTGNCITAEEQMWHAKYLVHAASLYGKAMLPAIPGLTDFPKDRLKHTSQIGQIEPCSGRSVVVVGCANSAHDVAAEYLNKGASSVTMIQRSSTVVMNQKVVSMMTGRYYNQNQVASADVLDFEANAQPRAFQKRMAQAFTQRIAETADKQLLTGLHDAGFALNLGPDGAGMVFQLFEHAGGFYQDVGASQLIIDGKIKVVRGDVVAIERDKVVLRDGTALPADDIVMGTGYEKINDFVRRLYGKDVGDNLGPVWGLDEEGEVMNVGATNVPNFYVMAGNVAQCRLLSKQVALIIKAQQEGFC